MIVRFNNLSVNTDNISYILNCGVIKHHVTKEEFPATKIYMVGKDRACTVYRPYEEVLAKLENPRPRLSLLDDWDRYMEKVNMMG